MPDPRFLPGLAMVCIMAFTAAAAESGPSAALAPQRVLIDVRSNHSDGAHGMDELVRMAARRGIDVLAFTEHDRTGIRLGLAPMPGLLGYTIERPSLYTTGLQAFFADLARMRDTYVHMGFLAGTESTPGYDWSGLPFRDLTLHGVDRHIITLGAESPEQIEALPSYDLRHVPGHRGLSMMFWALVVTAAFFPARKGRRWAMLLLGGGVAAWVVLLWPAEQDDADATFIAAARGQGLFTIWAHPGTHSGERDGPMGIRLVTPSYSKRVFSEPTADAFAAVYGDSDANTMAGGLWDRYMMAYMRGEHARPIWGVAAGDFHAQGEAHEYLGNFPMDVWAGNRSTVLAALRAGHMVAWGLPKGRNLRMRTLSVSDGHGRHLLPGDEAHVDDEITLYANLAEVPAAATAGSTAFPAEIIVDGKVVRQPVLAINEPAQFTLHLAPGAHVLRLRMAAGAIRMEANPFLLRVGG